MFSLFLGWAAAAAAAAPERPGDQRRAAAAVARVAAGREVALAGVEGDVGAVRLCLVVGGEDEG